MQNRTGIVGNNDSVSRVVIFLIQKPYAEQHCPGLNSSVYAVPVLS